MAMHFDSLRRVSLLGGICALDFALFILAVNSQIDFSPDLASSFGFSKMLCWLIALACVIVLWRKGLERDRLLAIGIPGIFIATSFVISGITFMGDPPARDGLANVMRAIVSAFSPYQYGLPIYAALILLAASVVFLVCIWFFRKKAPLAITIA